MMRSKTRRAIDKAEDKNFLYKVALGFFGSLPVLQAVALIVYPNFIRVFHPADLSKAATTQIGEIPKHQVHGFTMMVWQQLNNWRGDELYTPENQLERLRCFMTDQFYEDMKDLNQAESVSRKGKVKNITPLPDYAFDPNRDVVSLGSQTWDIVLNTLVFTSVKGAAIKNGVGIRYKFRVTYSDRDPECNQWGLLLSQMNDAPRRILMSGSAL